MNKLVLIGAMVWVAAVGLGAMIPPEQTALADFVSLARRAGLVIIVVGIAMLCMQKKQ
jgi:hypothetical protein